MIRFGLGIPAGKLVVPSASMSARSSSSGLPSRGSMSTQIRRASLMSSFDGFLCSSPLIGFTVKYMSYPAASCSAMNLCCPARSFAGKWRPLISDVLSLRFVIATR